MYTDMFCCIIAETAYTHLNKLVDESHVVFLEQWILSIYIRKTADSLKSALCAVIIVLNALKSFSMEHLFPSAYSLIEFICNKINIECCMIRKYIN